MIPEIDQQTLDFDWFFTDGEHIGHIASGGGKLPPSIAMKTADELDILLDFFKNLPEKSSFQVNAELSTIIGSPFDDRYLNDFAAMAKRGLYSFDRTVPNHFADTRYHLVAKPDKPLKLVELSPEIGDIISRSRFGDSLDVTTIDSTQVS